MERTLTFSAAKKAKNSGIFSTMVKPVGSTCNLRCAYCYYLEKAELYGGHQPVMSIELLEEYIRQYIAAVETPVVSFCWHGGEPLIAGLPFFRKAVELQRKYANGKRIENSLQTNGTLVNEEWCQFFYENQFLIGLSLDGTPPVHDTYRKDAGGHPTFEKVLRAAAMMQHFHVDFNILATVNHQSVGRGKEVYQFLRQLSPFIQFLPVVEEGLGVTGQEYGDFMCDVYDEWRKTDIGRVYVQLFDVTLEQWCGHAASLCALGETCGDSMVVEHNGDVYCCDHFVAPEYKMGNILHPGESLSELKKSQIRFDFSARKFAELPGQCRKCQWLFLCHGGCMEHRLMNTRKGEDHLNSFCKGYKMFFEHTESDMRQMRSLLERGLPPAMIMQEKRLKQ